MSKSKSVTIGLRLNAEKRAFEPVIFLTNCSTNAIVAMDEHDWEALCELFTFIERFFVQRYWTGLSVFDKFPNLTVTLKSAHGEKCVVFMEKEKKDEPVPAYKPLFVIKEKTFLNLMALERLGTDYIKFLNSSVPACKKVLDGILSIGKSPDCRHADLECMLDRKLIDERSEEIVAAAASNDGERVTCARIYNELLFPDTSFLSLL